MKAVATLPTARAQQARLQGGRDGRYYNSDFGWEGDFALAHSRSARPSGHLRCCVSPLPAARLYREECFCETNPTEKFVSVWASIL